MVEPERTFLPAAGRDLFLPLYDPLTKLLGFKAILASLIRQADLEPGFRVLDVGCGTGTLAVTIKRQHPSIDIVALDPDRHALARAGRKAARAGVSIQFDRGFSDSLPYDRETFDRVFSSMMFHHLRRAEREPTLREIRRVLKPGGRLEFLDLVSDSAHSHGFLARMLHPPKQLDPNADRPLLELMSRAGLADPRRIGDRNTIVGPVGFYEASAA